MRKSLTIDPRTKFYMMFLVSFVTMTTVTTTLGWIIKLAITIVPIILLFFEGRYSVAVKFIAFYLIALGAMKFFVLKSTGIVGALALGYCSIVMQFFPSVIMAWYTVRSTKINEFMAAMGKMRLPKGLSISLAVMIRFFPTIKEEYLSIKDAMKMRGISLGKGKVGKMIEYRMIPLLFSCVNIGEELSAAAVTRGLGSPVKRSNICEIGFHRVDAFLITLFTGLIACYILTL